MSQCSGHKGSERQYSKADVIHAGLLDAGAVECAHRVTRAPRNDAANRRSVMLPFLQWFYTPSCASLAFYLSV
jgi:hypothetical protein